MASSRPRNVPAEPSTLYAPTCSSSADARDGQFKLPCIHNVVSLAACRTAVTALVKHDGYHNNIPDMMIIITGGTVAEGGTRVTPPPPKKREGPAWLTPPAEQLASDRYRLQLSQGADLTTTQTAGSPVGVLLTGAPTAVVILVMTTATSAVTAVLGHLAFFLVGISSP